MGLRLLGSAAPLCWSGCTAATPGPRVTAGRLCYSWPRRADRTPLNRGDAGYDVLEYRVETAPTAPVFIELGESELALTNAFQGASGTWRTLAIPLGCYRSAGTNMIMVGAPPAIRTSGPFAASVSDVRIASADVPQNRCAQP